MNYSWNVTSEVLRRECGFSKRCGIRTRNSSVFNESIMGSSYMAQQITAVKIVGKKYTNPRSLNFNRNGDLLCVGYYDKQIAIYDWEHNNLKYCFNSKHTEDPNDVKLINIGENTLDIVSTSNDGQIRHTQISPTGKVTSTCLHQNVRAKPSLAEVPQTPNEFVGVNYDGNIFLMDLRCIQPVCLSDAYVSSDTGEIMSLYDIAHHPFVSEFCVGGDDAFLRVFDKRNLGECVQKMCPKNLENAVEINQCSYNYNGSEILANYYEEGAYLFNSRNYTPGEYLGCYQVGHGSNDVAGFFGPRSEFVIYTNLSDCIYIFHKKSEKFVKCESLPPGKNEFYSMYQKRGRGWLNKFQKCGWFF